MSELTSDVYTLATPEISIRQEIADIKTIIYSLGRQNIPVSSPGKSRFVESRLRNTKQKLFWLEKMCIRLRLKMSTITSASPIL